MAKMNALKDLREMKGYNAFATAMLMGMEPYRYQAIESLEEEPTDEEIGMFIEFFSSSYDELTTNIVLE